MLDQMLTFLTDTVNDYLSTSSGWSAQDAEHGQVVFIDSDKVDVPNFKMGAISILLTHVEEEHTLRPADPYRRTQADGTVLKVQPPLHLNAYVLFVARFKDYKQSLRYISLILQFFLTHRVLDHENSPGLSTGIEKLTMELLNLPLSEQNYLWSILRSTCQPSLLFRVRMAVFRDPDGIVIPAAIAPAARINQ